MWRWLKQTDKITTKNRLPKRFSNTFRNIQANHDDSMRGVLVPSQNLWPMYWLYLRARLKQICLLCETTNLWDSFLSSPRLTTSDSSVDH